MRIILKFHEPFETSKSFFLNWYFLNFFKNKTFQHFEAKENPAESDFISSVSKKLGVRLVKFGNCCYSSKSDDFGDKIGVDLENLSFLKPLQNENEEMDLMTQLSQLAQVKEEGSQRETAEKLIRSLVNMYDT